MSFIADLKEFNQHVASLSGVSVRVWHDHTKELHISETQRQAVDPVSSYFFKSIKSGYDVAHRVLTVVTDPIVFLIDFGQTFLYGLYCLFKKAVELHTGVEDPLEPLPALSDYTSYFIQCALGIIVSPLANLVDLIGSAHETYKASRNIDGGNVREPDASAAAVNG